MKRLLSVLARRLLGLFGWQVIMPTPFPGPCGVMILYPHTSNWDFIVGMLGKLALGLEVRWLGKASLFTGFTGLLLGPLMRALGGEPVERGNATGAIGRLAQRFHQHESYWLAFAPEGTRHYRERWRSGFYHITLAAKVPLALLYLDYPRRQIGIDVYLTMSGDEEQDKAAIRAAYAGHRGKHPELEGPIDW
jgi:1-acyl-sn-glycerol-3-phosphate acyltransferase